jgi:hypothetical protein
MGVRGGMVKMRFVVCGLVVGVVMRMMMRMMKSSMVMMMSKMMMMIMIMLLLLLMMMMIMIMMMMILQVGALSILMHSVGFKETLISLKVCDYVYDNVCAVE